MPRDDEAQRRRPQGVGRRLEGDARRLLDQPLAVGRRQQPAAVERVEQHLLAVRHGLGHEMARQADADHLQPGPAAHRHRHRRQRDRDALAAVHDLVEIAVTGVVVFVGVAVKAHVLEQVAAEQADARLEAAAQPRAGPRGPSPPVRRGRPPRPGRGIRRRARARANSARSSGAAGSCARRVSAASRFMMRYYSEIAAASRRRPITHPEGA